MKLRKLFFEKPDIWRGDSRRARAIPFHKKWRVWVDKTCVYVGDVTLLADKKTYQITPTLRIAPDQYRREGKRMVYNPHNKPLPIITTTNKSEVVPLFKKILLESLYNIMEKP